MPYLGVDTKQQFPRISPMRGRVPLGEHMLNVGVDTLEVLPFRNIYRATELALASVPNEYNRILSPEEANQRWGIPDDDYGDGGVKFTKPITDQKAYLINQYKLKERDRQKRVAKGSDSTGRMVAGFGTGLVAQAVDPINLAFMFLFPGMGEARTAAMAVKTGMVSAKIAQSASGVAVGMATTEPFSYLSKLFGEQNEYGPKDSLMNFGAGLLVGTGISLGMYGINTGLSRAAKRLENSTPTMTKHIIGEAVNNTLKGDPVDADATIRRLMENDVRNKARRAGKKMEAEGGPTVKPAGEPEIKSASQKLAELAKKQTEAYDSKKAVRVYHDDLTPEQLDLMAFGRATFDVVAWRKVDANGKPVTTAQGDFVLSTKRPIGIERVAWEEITFYKGNKARELALNNPAPKTPGSIVSYGKSAFLVQAEDGRAWITQTKAGPLDERLALLRKIYKETAELQEVYYNGAEISRKDRMSFLSDSRGVADDVSPQRKPPSEEELRAITPKDATEDLKKARTRRTDELSILEREALLQKEVAEAHDAITAKYADQEPDLLGGKPKQVDEPVKQKQAVGADDIDADDIDADDLDMSPTDADGIPEARGSRAIVDLYGDLDEALYEAINRTQGLIDDALDDFDTTELMNLTNEFGDLAADRMADNLRAAGRSEAEIEVFLEQFDITGIEGPMRVLDIVSDCIVTTGINYG
jgi:hypothetical protein